MREIEIMESARKHLSTALADPRLKTLPDAGWRWHSYCIYARQQINRFRTPLEVIHFVQESQQNVGFETRMSGRQLFDYARVMEKNCLNIFPDFANFLPTFQESALSFPETLVVFNGRLVSTPLYNHIIHTMRCLTYIKPQRVVEIGGGYGAPGRIWMTNGIHTPMQYIDVDFPESLFYTECYLRATMPDYNIVYLSKSEDFKTLEKNENKSIFLCPISFVPELMQYDMDLITNTGSLQEMSDGYVDFYMQAIAASKSKAFYSFNYFAQPLDQLLDSMNLGAPTMNGEWITQFKAFYSGDSRQSVAEILFTRLSQNCQEESIKIQIDSYLSQGMPRNGFDFLELFDLIRQIDDSAYMMKIVKAAVERMPHIPKEALLLARKAQDPSEAELLKNLEQIAEYGRKDMGVVGSLVSHIRDRLMREGSTARFSIGRLIELAEGTSVEIDRKIKKARHNLCGSVERVELDVHPRLISGWAMDREANERALRIHVFHNGCLLRSEAPTIQRREFKVTFPIGFEFTLPISIVRPDRSQLLVLAEFNDGSVGALANGGEVKIIEPAA